MHRPAYILAALTVAAYGAAARAGDVALEVATREAYVGEPVQVQIQVINATNHEPPEFPMIPGVRVRPGQVGTNRSGSLGRGGMTWQTTVTYSYSVIPTAPGKIEIPPIPVRVDGRVLKTAATTILVTSSETSELLFVELASDRESVYLGEAIEVGLEIWLYPYRDRNVRDGLSVNDMLSRFDFDNSRWGSFRDTVIRLRNRELKWRYRSDTRVDSQGVERAYYVYVISLSFAPTTAGPLDVGQVNVLVSYPTRTGRGNDFFPSMFSRYQVTRARTVQASLGEPDIVVKPLPTEGQPAHFNGAVGRYAFAAEASPRQVRVREPIEVTLTIAGQGVLERVPPPPLARLAELARDFKVPDEILGGIVEGGRKRFTVKLGARSAAVSAIPAIPFCFFDPQAERYVTRWSEPIPLEVTASQQLAVSQFTETGQADHTGATRLTETAVGLRANYVDMDEVLTQQSFEPGWGSTVLLVCTPMAYLFCVAARRHRDRLAHDRGYVRRRRARARAVAALREAGRREDPTRAAGGAASAVIGYISDRDNAPPGLTRAEAIERLGRHAVGQERLRSTQRLLERCESLQYARADSETTCELLSEAGRCIEELERERF